MTPEKIKKRFITQQPTSFSGGRRDGWETQTVRENIRQINSQTDRQTNHFEVMLGRGRDRWKAR